MKRKVAAPVALTFLVVLFAASSVAAGSRHFGHFALSRSGGSAASFGGHRSHLKLSKRHMHFHSRFGRGKDFHQKKAFRPHHHFRRHHVLIPRQRIHGGFFFGHREFVAPSFPAVWSHTGRISGLTVPPESVTEESVFDRPLITIMLRNHQELSLSSQQVQDLEELRDRYQRQAIRYNADNRIAELELQSLLKADVVDLEQVKAKLQDIEHVKMQLRLARISAIEQGKALLSSEQHKKLQALLGGSRYSRYRDEQLREPTEQP